MTPTEHIISKWAKNLTKTIVDTRYLDAKEIESQLKIQMSLAMREALNVQLSETERQINLLKTEIYQHDGETQIKLQNELINRKSELTQQKRLIANTNKIIAQAQKQDIVRKAYTYIYERFGKEEVENFKKTLQDA